MTCHVIARLGHMTIPRRRGGGTHCVIGNVTQAFIGGEIRALGLIGPMPVRELNNTGIRTFLEFVHGRAILGHNDHFLLIARLSLILKGYT